MIVTCIYLLYSTCFQSLALDIWEPVQSVRIFFLVHAGEFCIEAVRKIPDITIANAILAKHTINIVSALAAGAADISSIRPNFDISSHHTISFYIRPGYT